MIKAIIFDYGNVISSVNNNLFLEEISRVTGIAGHELNTWVKECTEHLRHYETGLVATDDFFKRVVVSGGMELERETFIRLFTGRFSPLTETRELIKRLKARYTLALLSNTNAWDYEHEIKQSDVFPLFDRVTLSFEVGAMKPDRKIYDDALNKLAMAPGECVYVDDIKEYADAASDIGIKGIHYTSHQALDESLRMLGCYPG